MKIKGKYGFIFPPFKLEYTSQLKHHDFNMGFVTDFQLNLFVCWGGLVLLLLFGFWFDLSFEEAWYFLNHFSFALEKT